MDQGVKMLAALAPPVAVESASESRPTFTVQGQGRSFRNGLLSLGHSKAVRKFQIFYVSDIFSCLPLRSA
jgi:hypothetical protein